MQREKRRLPRRVTGIGPARSYRGQPRVRDDMELYGVIGRMAMAGESVEAIQEYMELWASPYEDWQLAVIGARARLFLGSLRKEVGRRLKLDPNQLRLKGF